MRNTHHVLFCYISKGLRSVFDESSQTAWFVCNYIPINSHKTLTNYIPVFSGRITLSTGENCMKLCSVVFEFIADRQTDRETRRSTLFYNMYRYDLNMLDSSDIQFVITYRDVSNWKMMYPIKKSAIQIRWLHINKKLLLFDLWKIKVYCLVNKGTNSWDNSSHWHFLRFIHGVFRAPSL